MAFGSEDGLTLKLTFELEEVGDDDICTQLLKLSDDSCKEPEQVVFEVFVVMVLLSIASEKVTAIVEVSAIEVSESDGEVEDTVGAVVSVSVSVSVLDWGKD